MTMPVDHVSLGSEMGLTLLTQPYDYSVNENSSSAVQQSSALLEFDILLNKIHQVQEHVSAMLLPALRELCCAKVCADPYMFTQAGIVVQKYSQLYIQLVNFAHSAMSLLPTLLPIVFSPFSALSGKNIYLVSNTLSLNTENYITEDDEMAVDVKKEEELSYHSNHVRMHVPLWQNNHGYSLNDDQQYTPPERIQASVNASRTTLELVYPVAIMNWCTTIHQSIPSHVIPALLNVRQCLVILINKECLTKWLSNVWIMIEQFDQDMKESCTPIHSL